VTIQAIGRLLRKHPGKERAVYVDFNDNHHKFLKAATKERRQALVDEGFGDYIAHWEGRGV
jgi:superfamily II DNA or RNA helicase